MAASFGGSELSKKINHDKKINYFGKISNSFDARSKELMSEEGWYLPRWEDSAIWKKQHNRGWEDNVSGTREGFRKRYPTPESLRDHCFQFLKSSMDQCQASNEHCTECLRQKRWG